jgi:hypothetical protein
MWGQATSPVQAGPKLGSDQDRINLTQSLNPNFLRRPYACPSKPKLMLLHINPRAAEGNSLHPQAKFLLRAVLSLQLNRATGAHHPMPRQSRSLAQDAHYLPRRARPSRRACNRSVTRHLAYRQSTDAPHHASAPCVHAGRSFFARHFFPRLRFRIPLRHAHAQRQTC